jgi:hypothetical protein
MIFRQSQVNVWNLEKLTSSHHSKSNPKAIQLIAWKIKFQPFFTFWYCWVELRFRHFHGVGKMIFFKSSKKHPICR